MDEIQRRVAELERRLADALGQAEQNHPELLAKEIAILRGKVASVYELAQELDVRLGHIETLVAAQFGTGPN